MGHLRGYAFLSYSSVKEEKANDLFADISIFLIYIFFTSFAGYMTYTALIQYLPGLRICGIYKMAERWISH